MLCEAGDCPGAAVGETAGVTLRAAFCGALGPAAEVGGDESERLSAMIVEAVAFGRRPSICPLRLST